MARYIDPSKIKLTGLTFEDINNEVYFSLSDVRKAIEQTPTADVVEVVRCKDCKYWEQVTAERHACRILGFEMDYDEYCSYGTPKERALTIVEHGWLFVGVLRYKDKEYTIHYDFGNDYDKESAKWMFLEGNYSCDCNRSLFIRREYGEDAIPELDCGGEIKLLSYQVYEPFGTDTREHFCSYGERKEQK